LKADYDVTVRWRAFPLHPEIPDYGISLKQLFANQPVDIEGMMARLSAVADAEGLPFGERTVTYNSRKAQELSKWAESRGRAEPFHDAAFAAYFVRGENLADRSVLTELAESVGLDGREAINVLDGGRFADAVDADWAEARALGVTAVPTLIRNGNRLVGAQPYESMVRLVKAAGGDDGR
jgi:predicted DsbA family dithiol-disulfide isomerase